MPAVSICTEPFEVTARAMAGVYGFPGYEFAVVPHPVASLDEDQISARVDVLIPQLLKILGVES